MIRNVLSSIDNVGLYPTIAFVAFFTVFLFVSYLAFRMDKKTVDHLRELPLADEIENPKS